MRIETKKIREGQYVGDTVWICQYLRPDLDKKPLRNVSPIKVLVVSTSELKKGAKSVYYSSNYFCPFNKKGERSAKIISPVDNTGYRSFCGNEIDVFTEAKECIKEWNAQIDVVCAALQDREINSAANWKLKKETLLATKFI